MNTRQLKTDRVYVGLNKNQALLLVSDPGKTSRHRSLSRIQIFHVPSNHRHHLCIDAISQEKMNQ